MYPLNSGFKWAQFLWASLLLTVAASAWAQGSDSKPTHAMPEGARIANRYLVVFKASVVNPSAEADNLIKGTGGQVHFRYNAAIRGFAATIPAAALNGIRNNPNVEFVEEDKSVRLNQVSSPQSQATWGLDRVDQVDRPLSAVNRTVRFGSK